MLSHAPTGGSGQHKKHEAKKEGSPHPKENAESTKATKRRENYVDDFDQQKKSNPQVLPIDFSPTPYTVIIGKGKMMRENLGNKRLRVLASNFLARYSETNEKRAKTLVVNEIIDSIRSAGGFFVRKEKDGRWYLATDQAVREKIGYVFRDLLCDKYRSSSKSKAERRQKEQFDRASTRLERAMRMTKSGGESDISRQTIVSFDASNTAEGKKTELREEHDGNSSEIRRDNQEFWQDFE